MLLPLIAVVLLLVAAPPALAQQARPNVVVFMTDDQTVSQVEFMPNVQRLLVNEGTSFSRFFATFPLCCPSRATMLTGQYAHNHGVLHNAGPFGGYRRLDHSRTLPVWLHAVGYRTLQVGRWLNGYGVQNTNQAEVPLGFDEWFVPVGTSAQAYQDQTINENGELKHFTDYQTDLYAEKAIELIRAAPSPFFLSMNFSAPHSGRPGDPDDPSLRTPSPAPRHRDAYAHVELPSPPSFNEANIRDKPQDVFERPRLAPEMIEAIRENWQQELESLLSVDEAIGQVVAELSQQGRLDNTLIVFVSDNGFMHGEHRIPAEKVWPYDESARVPLILRGPGVPENLELGQLTANVDLVPTILEAGDAAANVPLDGRSLFELMEDPTLEWGREILLQSGFGANGVGAYRALRNYRYLFVHWKHSGERELYDLRRDPWQMRNLSGRIAYEQEESELARRLGALRGCYGARCYRPPDLSIASTRRCARRSRTVRIRGRELEKLDRVDFLRGRRVLARDRRPPFEVELRQASRIRARAVLRYGRMVTLERRLRPCLPEPTGPNTRAR
jgi:N-acetylglucosamine-6-sulfatase